MFVRSKRVKGRTYYQVVSTYRDGGKVRHRTHASLGTHPTIEAAYQEALERWTSCGRPWKPGWPLFERVIVLDALRERPDNWVTQKHLKEQQQQQEPARAAEEKQQAEEKRRRKEERRQEKPRKRGGWAAFKEQLRQDEEERSRKREERAAEEQRRREERAAEEHEDTLEESWAKTQAMLDSMWESLLARRTGNTPQAAASILGVEWPCDLAAAKAARRRKALECHPDHGGSVKAMAEINAAYSALERYFEMRGKLD